MVIDHNSVWENAFGPGALRGFDCCGAMIYKAAYVDRNSKYGWEVDHKVPVSRGGSDAPSNLRPLHWANNDAKSDNLDGYWACAVGRVGYGCTPDSERPYYGQ